MKEKDRRAEEIIQRWIERRTEMSRRSHLEEILSLCAPSEVRAHLGLCAACAAQVSGRYFEYRAAPASFALPPGLTLCEFVEAWRRFAALKK